MFSRGNQEEQNDSPNPIVEKLMIDDLNDFESNLPTDLEDDVDIEIAEEQPETVKLVEKISGILSPYFIVLVGLYLYDDNFFFGGILILTGILSLLKISYQDIWQGINKIKQILIQDDSLD